MNVLMHAASSKQLTGKVTVWQSADSSGPVAVSCRPQMRMHHACTPLHAAFN